MASNLSVILSGAVAQVINTVDSTTRVNSSLGNPALTASQDVYNYFVPVPNADTGAVIVNPAFVLYVRNLGGIGGSPAGNVTIKVTPVAGVEATVGVLPPGGVFAYWCTSESAGGITALTLNASIANTPVEILSAA